MKTRALVLAALGLVFGSCSLLDSDLGIRELSDPMDCYVLSHHKDNGALQCYELREGTCKPAGEMVPSKAFLELRTPALDRIQVTATPLAPSGQPAILMTAPKCEGDEQGTFRGLLSQPTTQGTLRELNLRVRSEGVTVPVQQMALALPSKEHAIAYVVYTPGCEGGRAALLTAAIDDATDFALDAEATCASAAWPTLALRCIEGECDEGIAVHLETRPCEHDPCAEQPAVPGSCLARDRSGVSVHTEHFRWTQEGLAAREKFELPSSVAVPVVPPAVAALTKTPATFVVAHAAPGPGACESSKSNDSQSPGIVIRAVTRTRNDACLFVPTSEPQRVAASSGAPNPLGESESALVAWTTKTASNGVAVHGAIVDVDSQGVHLRTTLELGHGADEKLAPRVSYAARGGSLDSPTGFWSVTWTRATASGATMVSRVSEETLGLLGTMELSSDGSAPVAAFAFPSGSAPLEYGLTALDARNVASTWTLKCAK